MMRRFVGSGKNVPPVKEDIIIYFLEKVAPAGLATQFFNYFEDRNWKNNKGNPLSNWKTAAWEWIFKNWISTNR